MDDSRLLVTVNEAASRLGLSRSMVYKLLNNGQLEGVKIGRSRRVRVEELSRFVEELDGAAVGSD